MRTHTKRLGLTRPQADNLRRLSVWLNIIGFCFFVTGNVFMSAAFKIAAEAMRLPFFEHIKARDMTGLGVFFIAGSILALFLNK